MYISGTNCKTRYNIQIVYDLIIVPPDLADSARSGQNIVVACLPRLIRDWSPPEEGNAR